MSLEENNSPPEMSRVRYRHSGMDLPSEKWATDEIECQTLSTEQLMKETEGHTLTHLLTFDREILQDIHVIAPQLTHLFLKFTTIETGEINRDNLISLCKLDKLEVLGIADNKLSSDGLPDIFTNKSSLRELDLSNCQLTTLPSSLCKLDKLEVLTIADNKFSSDGLPDIFPNMSALRKLYLANCQLTTLPASLCKLDKLELLNLSQNQISSDGLADIFTNMSYLRELYMYNCQLTTLPASLCKLGKLQVLSLSKSQFSSHGLPDIFTNMSYLKRLYLSNCQLTTLPASLCKLDKLEVLDISRNPISSKGLADIFTNMSSLRKLYLYSCQLTTLPASIGNLQQLCELDMRNNRFERLPSLVYDLLSLQSLDICSNCHLESLDSQILQLTQLKQFDATYCENLSSPPREVCGLGIEAIQQYYQDLEKGVGRNLPSATIAVIGNTMAGKTSLIKTLQSPDETRVLTDRSAKAEVDETTRVFNVEIVEVENTVLRFIDMGGQEIYHTTYQLTLKQNCIPVIVLSMQQYKECSTENNPREAVRRLAFDWLSHLYLANPNLGSPKLIITHIDVFEKPEYTELKNSFLATTNDLCKEIVKEEAQLGGEFCKIEHFSDMSSPVFQSEDIYEVGNDGDYSAFTGIKTNILKSCQHFIVPLPQIWEDVNDKILSLQAPFSTFKEIFEILHEADDSIEQKQLKTILTYMHDCGKLLWYQSVPDLQPYIFHKISEVTKLLCVLYTHEEGIWEKRSNEFIPYLDCNQQRVEKEDFEDLLDNFLATGIIDTNLLHYLIRTETAFTSYTDVETGVAILRSFRLLFGPLQRHSDRPSFILPYFTKGYYDLPDDIAADLTLQVDLQFKGLSLPRYVYHQMSVGVLDIFSNETDIPVVKQNGVDVFHNDFGIRLIHNYTSRSATIQIASSVENICELWDKLINITNSTISHVLSTWKASRVICSCVCAHCLLLGNTRCVTKTNPSWCIRSLTSTRHIPGRRDGYTTTLCKKDRIPSCLQYPCRNLSVSNKQSLKICVDKLKQQNDSKKPPKDEPEVPDLPPNVNTNVDSDLSDGEGYFFPEDDDDKKFIKMEVRTTTKPGIKQLFSNTDQVYQMSTPVRGRALVINNDNFKGSERDGSEFDTKNIVDMLKKFKLKVTDFLNLTAKEMLSKIKSETQNKGHNDYQLFMLVIMTHGNTNDILYGVDKVAVRLIDVIDLLSPQNFPGMAGKPKVLIIEACGGSRGDFGDRVVQVPSDSTSVGLPPVQLLDPAKKLGCLNVDDLIVFKSSFESYKSMRHPEFGTLFIRCLVTTLYKHACHRDVCELFRKVRDRVRKLSIELAEKFADSSTFGQVPICYDTLTHGRKLYLFPGYDGKPSTK